MHGNRSPHRTGRPVDREEIIDEALRSRPLGFYVSYDYALSRLAALRHHNDTMSTFIAKGGRRAMWAELDELVGRHMRRSPKMKITDALTMAITYGRPSRFHISHRKAREIFDRVMTSRIVYHPRRPL